MRSNGKPRIITYFSFSSSSCSPELSWQLSQLYPQTTFPIPQPSANNTREDSTHGHHQMVNTEIRLIIFFAAKDGEGLYSQQKRDWKMTVAQILNSVFQNSDLN